MSQLLTSEFIKQAKQKLKYSLDKVQIENTSFRLFSKLTSAILFVCCGLVTLQQLIGEHIKCLNPPKDDVRPEALNQYCFIMSTFTLPHLYNKTVGLDVPHPGVGPYKRDEDETKYHAYYQWVPFVLFFQAFFFVIPHLLWKSAEGGLLKAYCTLNLVEGHQLKHRFIMNESDDEVGIRNRKTKQKSLTKVAEYFIYHMNHNHRYAYFYVFTEILNFAIVVLNIYLTDVFLGNEFSTYGPEVLSFLTQDAENRLDPMNRVFPKVTKCDFYKFGPSGSLINYDVMCVLALNIMNEKIYTFLWFWFVFISIAGGLALVYRIAVICAPGMRNYLIGARALDEDSEAVQEVAESLSYPDWFVLKRLSNNINRIRFGELCQSIRLDLRNIELTSPVHTASKPSTAYPDLNAEGGDNNDPEAAHPLIIT